MTGLFKPIINLFGFIMNGIFEALSLIGVENVGLCIVLFTIIIYMLMLPMQIKQQKFTRISAVMNPEIQAIQKKYQNKKDQASMLKMQEETKLVHEKYGTSPMGGCLGSLIQLPFLFALWPVVQNIPRYVNDLKLAYDKFDLISGIKATEGYQKLIETFAKNNQIITNNKSYADTNAIVDVLYKLQENSWDALAKVFPDLSDSIEKTQEYIKGFNYFPTANFGINIAETPSTMFKAAMADFSIIAIIIAVAIPLLAGFTQWLSVIISQRAMNANNPQEENAMAKQMGTMTKIMPIMSVVFCFSMPVGLGIYWITSAVVRTIQQILIDKRLNKKTIEEIVEENVKKANKKRDKKKAADSKNVNSMAQMYTRRIEETKAKILEDAEKRENEASQKESKERVSTYQTNAKPGSLAAKANMVSEYNKRNNK